MGQSQLKLFGQLAAIGSLLFAAPGCAYVNVGNPLLPTARLIAVPEPATVTVKMSYSQAQNTITTTPDDLDIVVSSYQNDGTPGVYFHSYSAEYFDMAGKPIPSVLLAKSNFSMSAYIPPASTKAPSSLKLKLPVYNQQVRLYGMDQAYTYAGGPALNPNFSHTISARVTLYGEDDNYNPVQFTLNVPIRFDAEVTQ